MTVLPEIDSRFEVIAKLGEGGMGTVYKVRHRDLDEIQIVKTMQAHFTTNEGLCGILASGASGLRPRPQSG